MLPYIALDKNFRNIHLLLADEDGNDERYLEE